MNLQKRQIQLDGQYLLCAFCKEVPEDLSRLFFACPISHNIWKRWYHIMRLNSTLPHLAIDHSWQHAHRLVGRKANGWWVVGWCTIIWILWSQCNEIVFEGKELL